VTADPVDARIARGMSRQLEERRRLLGSGARHVGWKAGFGAPAALRRFGLRGPLVGYLTDATLLPVGTSIAAGGWVNPVAEPELAVHIGADVPDQAEEDQVRQAIAGIGPAIELADIDPPPDDIEEILAGDIFHRAVVLGKPDPALAGGSIGGVTGGVTHDGVSLQPITEFEGLTGSLLDVLAHIADTLGSSGEALRAGDVVITGSVITALPIGPGQSVEFRLGNSAPVSVRLH
jgi:2-keto-4-pentenoate hydratase